LFVLHRVFLIVEEIRVEIYLFLPQIVRWKN